MPSLTSTKSGNASVSEHSREAAEYLNKNKVPQIIQQLICACLYEQPDDPREFMVRKLEEMRSARARGQSLILFTRGDLQALFRIFDVTGRGWITKEQYDAAMKNIGAAEKSNQRPSGVDQNRIRSDTFVEEALSALSRA
ncbi:uncharacterized protein SPPG_04004 [Spizellomyces punctatus DAOM BR117]|uniref:EF-hand domain-containing protein n=1 Tax=Spizellomyces punctatus (strain DAOM BR117) TaxID=645134 RepID=A0A0L0HJ90_SPIPD|nr:uncharacterized protein SPPG_04004 [Spizellomyces punctatus DAOM BR117]KND00904.1 hypothetical protein SPPG_04004 [Spizellomyces punctatus DAOM BR117]|eukprot:XP_016608943.1 hypothetical protein SPPG_04004 [Spizellomyces punctatus DAOM BR117]